MPSDIVQPLHPDERFCSRCGQPLGLREEGGRLRPACPGCGQIVFGHFSVGVGGLIVRRGRILLVQRAHDPGRGRWTLPGGYVEEDEAPHDAIVREVLEETALTVVPRALLAIRHAQNAREQNLYLVFSLALHGPPSALRPDGREIADARWVRPDELASLGTVGSISQWVIERFARRPSGFGIIPAEQQPPPVSTHRWTALYATPPSRTHRRTPLSRQKE